MLFNEAYEPDNNVEITENNPEFGGRNTSNDTTFAENLNVGTDTLTQQSTSHTFTQVTGETPSVWETLPRKNQPNTDNIVKRRK